MAQCAYCGAETSLHVHGVPRCVECDARIEADCAERKPCDKEEPRQEQRKVKTA